MIHSLNVNHLRTYFNKWAKLTNVIKLANRSNFCKWTNIVQWNEWTNIITHSLNESQLLKYIVRKKRDIFSALKYTFLRFVFHKNNLTYEDDQYDDTICFWLKNDQGIPLKSDLIFLVWLPSGSYWTWNGHTLSLSV